MEANRTEGVLTVAARPPGAPLKVLFLMIQMEMGGSERLVLNLVKTLDRRLFSPSVAWFIQPRPLKEFDELGVPLYYMPKRKRFDWNTVRQLRKVIRAEHIDIVNAHHFMPFFYASCAVTGTRARLVYTEHSEEDVRSAAGVWQRVGRRLLSRSDAVVGISDKVTSALQTHFRVTPEKAHTIENGVDIESFRGRNERRAAARQRVGIAPDDLVIGHVGNFRRNKNHVFLLRAFQRLATERRDIKLVFVGQGFEGDPENSHDEVARFIRNNGLTERVLLLGYQQDVSSVLAMLDVFCLTSHKEGLPLSLLEAMATGLPVIGTDIEGIRRVIQPDVNGLLVRPDDAEGLAAALERMLRDAALRDRMGRASEQIARDRYALNRCVEQTERLFISAFRRNTETCQASA